MSAAHAVRLTVGVGIAIVAVAGALTLTRSPPRVVRASSRTEVLFVHSFDDHELCQGGEVLPGGVSAIRLALYAFYGLRVRVVASSGARVLTEGSRAPNWTGKSVTVPVAPLSHSFSHVTLCIEIGPNSEPFLVAGAPAFAREAATWDEERRLEGRVGVEYLAPGQSSWWSRILTVARHMGIGHALSGTWVAPFIAALVAAVGLLAVRLVLREAP